MHKGTKFALVALVVVGGYAAGRLTRDGGWSGTERGASGSFVPTSPMENIGAAVGGDVERKRVPLGGSAKGPEDALVNIVEFSDFECPFCSRVVPTIERLLKEYPQDVRVFFRHYPLPFHQNAMPAAQAAIAAEQEGKFWPMHDKLFANAKALDRASLDKYAQELGLDMAKWKAALDSNAHKARVEEDMALAGKLGVRGTPNFLINGRSVSGAQAYDTFKKIVDEEIARGKKLVASGVPREKVYAKLMEGDGSAPKPAAAPAAERPAVPQDVYKVTVGDAPTKGGKEPKVTIVAFSEFQCPFCSRVNPTLEKILETYKDDVQIAFKHFPLDFHDKAQIAAEASEAAHAQGKFWPMHEKLFANQSALDRASLDKYAQEIGLDMAKWKAFLDGGKGRAKVKADQEQGAKFGVQGTPSFFVNGRFLVGAQPFENWKPLIDEELGKAEAKLKAGVPRRELYAAIIKDGKDRAAAPAAEPGEPAPTTVYKADVAGAPWKGAKDALVTVVQFSDFQCPFCTRVEPTIDKLMEEYKGKIRIVWRDFPLDFHQNAIPAAIAARVAGEQKKFWEMHKKLFENQRALDNDSLVKYAEELKIDGKKMRAALESKKYEAQIKADMASGQKIGVSGTPAFFINGIFLSGAQPYERFKAIVDEQLAKAEALVKKGTPKGKVYDAIMKTAQASAAGAGGAAGGAPDTGPPKTVEIGKAPVKGPKNAPITVVVFSDFECPFCSRIEPTLDELEQQYPGKIRRVWKNYPLPFHQNAKPAAMAAHAAGEQKKFWEMHKKLFENQRALDGASLEKYAKELGLDVEKWKKAMQDPATAALVESDMKQAQEVGVSGTPATFINGRLVSGAVPIDQFKKIVDEELAKGNGKKRRS